MYIIFNFAHIIYMKKFAIITALSLVITVAVALGTSGCAKVDAKSAAHETNLMVRRTADVLKSLESIENSQFKFPNAFDKGFLKTNQIREKHSRHQKMRSSSDEYDNYLEKLDDLYLICSEISDKNEQIASKTAQIRDLVSVTRDLTKQLYDGRKELENNNEIYEEIKAQSVSTRQNLERLFSDRRSITKQIRQLPDTNNMNVNLSNVRFERIRERINYRIEMLDAVINNLEKLNNKLENALGIDQPQPEDEVSAEPITEFQRHIIFGFPVVRYASNYYYDI